MSEDNFNKTEQPAKKLSYRLPPCPAYDIEGMETWLSDMAQKGLLLSTDGFFAGFAIFERTEPRRVRYRFEASEKNAGVWGDESKPDEEAEGLSAAYGWTYVASRGYFFIYRSESESAPELNTDPQVQALTLNMVRKRERGSLFSTALLTLIYPIILLRGKLLLTAYTIGTGMFLLAAVLAIWMLAASILRVRYYGKLRRKLSLGEAMTHSKNWRRKAWYHWGSSALFILLAAVWGVFILRGWSNSVLEADKKPLADYLGTLPFATFADLAPEGDYSAVDYGFGNTIVIGSDLLAPSIISLNENASIALPDNQFLQGGLYIDYYETAAPWLAREAAREFSIPLRWDRWFSGKYQELELPELGVDYAFAYSDIFPTVILQEGSKVLHITLYQYQTSDYIIPLEDWVKVFADSLK